MIKSKTTGKTMKKAAALLMIFTLLFSLAGCSSNSSESSQTADTSVQTEDTAVKTEDSSTDTSSAVSTDDTAAQTPEVSSDASSENESAAGTTDASASSEDTAEEPAAEPVLPEIVNAAVLKGPTAIGMVNLMSANDAGTSSLKYSFQVAGAADEITADLIKGNIQIAAVPANLASVLYNKTSGGIKVAAINNLGVLYIVETGTSINSVEDLRGRTIYTTGQGTTPEYTLRYLLQMAGIDPDKDVTIEFKSEASEVAAVLAAAEEDTVAMLPQPYVTVAMTKSDKVRVALDVTEEWNKLAGEDSTVVTGVIVINAAFAEQYPDAVKLFLEEFEVSAGLANSDVEGTAALVESYDIFKAAIAKKAIPQCSITYIDGNEMKNYISAYLQVLYDQNPAAVGGSMPADDFYYGAD